MSIKQMNLAWEIECKTHTAKLVLISLADNASDEGICWPSLKTIAKRCGLSRQAVSRQIRQLKEDGLLNYEAGSRTSSNRYKLTLVGNERTYATSAPTQPKCLGVGNESAKGCATGVTWVGNESATNHKEPSFELSIEPSKEKRVKKEKVVSKSIPESEDEVKAFCKENGLTADDGAYMWNKWEGNGFENGGKKIKNWKAVIRSWKHGGWFPSQKAKANPAKPRYMTPEEIHAEKVRKNPNYI